MRGKILVIDDEETIRDFVKLFFEDREFDVTSAFDGQDGVEKFDKESFDLVVCDMLMPRMIGINVLKYIKEKKPEQKVIMMSGVREDTMVETAKKLGCYLYLNKPVRLSDLEAKICECFPEL